LPFFNSLANKRLELAYLSDAYLYVSLLALLVITSFLAGFYPSIILSALQPVKVLYHRYRTMGRNLLTKGLIVCQFALAIALIIGTLVINSQLNYMLRADLGYDSKGLVRLEIPVSKTSDPLPDVFRNELQGRPNVINVTGKNAGWSIMSVKADGNTIDVEKSKVDEHFIPTFRLTLIAGRNFSEEYPSDTSFSVIVMRRS